MPRAAGFIFQTLVLALAVVALPRSAPGAEASVRIMAGAQAVTLTADDIGRLPHVELTATDPHQKEAHTYSGVPMREILAKVNAPLGDRLRGAAMRMAVVFHSADGYQTVFALAEFDEAFSDRQLILADAQDGKPLPANAGPFRLVAPGDKRAARWARMVNAIELVSVGAPAP
jgi:DMSO/TMAO reductase YedYZ molybdopterin-dependent catalytic subunit